MYAKNKETIYVDETVLGGESGAAEVSIMVSLMQKKGWDIEVGSSGIIDWEDSEHGDQDEYDSDWGVCIDELSSMAVYVNTEVIEATYSDGACPVCPICGCDGHQDDGEWSYGCGHFVGEANPWTDFYEHDIVGLYRNATRRVITSHVLAGSNEWYFKTSSSEVDEQT